MPLTGVSALRLGLHILGEKGMEWVIGTGCLGGPANVYDIQLPAPGLLFGELGG